MPKLFFPILFFTLFLSACLNDSRQTSHLPNSPEEVVQKWQYFVDRNLLDSARLLSMEQALSYINDLDSLSMSEPLEVENNIMYDLKCTLQPDGRTVCDYFFEDELGYKMPDRLYLKKEGEQWKVATLGDSELLPEDEFIDSTDENMLFPDTVGFE